MISVPITSKLNDLVIDVLITSPTNGQLLTYVASAGKWENVTIDLSGYVPTSRTVNGHALSSNVTVTSSDIGLGNVENTALSTWGGSTNIVTLGSVATGTWSATTIAINKGGTGQVTANAAFNALAPSQTGNSGKFITTDGTNTSWGNPTPSGAALTKVDDTNVTLTLGGIPTTALLQATSITVGWSGTLSIVRGGTNNSSAYTTGSIPYFNGTKLAEDNANLSYTASTATLSATAITANAGNTLTSTIPLTITCATNGNGPRVQRVGSSAVIDYLISGASGYIGLSAGTDLRFSIDNFATSSIHVTSAGVGINRSGGAGGQLDVLASGTGVVAGIFDTPASPAVDPFQVKINAQQVVGVNSSGAGYFRKAGGTAGSQEGQLSHDGTNFNFANPFTPGHSYTYQFLGGSTSRGLQINTSDNSTALALNAIEANKGILFGGSTANHFGLTNVFNLVMYGGMSFGWSNANSVNGTTTADIAFSRSAFGSLLLTQSAASSGSPTALTVTGGQHTTLTASTESIGANLNFSATKQFSTGALTTQREVLIQAPTLAFVAASTVSGAYTLEINSAPIAGTNATLTEASAVRFKSGTASGLALILQGAASRTAPILQLQTSAGASIGNVGGSIFDHFADGASTHTDGTEDTLYTDTTIANTFQVNGDTIVANYNVLFAGTGSTTQVRAYFAGTKVLDVSSASFTNSAKIEIRIIRESSTVVIVEASLVGTATGFSDSVTYTRITGLTLTSTNIIKLTGTASGLGAAAGDITAKIGKISWLPAA